MPFRRLDAGSKWQTTGGASGITNTPAAKKIKFFVNKKVMSYVTGTPDGAPTSVGILRLSPDSGRTWHDAAMLAGCNGCLDVAEDASGGLWGLFYNSAVPGGGAGYTAKVGFSSDGGASWTLKYTHTAGHQAFNIAVSPDRGTTMRIGFLARNAQGSPGSLGTAYELVISTNAGVSWNTKSIPVVSMVNTSDVPLIQFASGRLMIYMPGEYSPPSGILFIAGYSYDTANNIWTTFNNAGDPSPLGFACSAPGVSAYLGRDPNTGNIMFTVSENAGASWTTSNAIPDADLLAMAADGDMFVTRGFGDEIWRSQNHGATWSLVYTAPSIVGYYPHQTITQISCHPTDPNRIAAFIFNRQNSAVPGFDDRNEHWFIAVSTNGGNSWTRYPVWISDWLIDGFSGPSGRMGWHVNGAISMAFELTKPLDNNFGMSIYTSTNDGATSSETLHEIQGGFPEGGWASEGHLYFVDDGGDGPLFDTANGTTFSTENGNNGNGPIFMHDGHRYLMNTADLWIDGVAKASAPDRGWAFQIGERLALLQ